MYKNIVKGIIIAGSLFCTAIFASPAITTNIAMAAGNAGSNIIEGADKTGQSGGPEVESTMKTVTNVLLFIIGAVAVIVIIIGGVMYTVSAGDSGKTKAAKDTILYAVVGLVIALFAYAITNFVVSNFSK